MLNVYKCITGKTYDYDIYDVEHVIYLHGLMFNEIHTFV